jgi:alpha-tubulin suppressor-like RCC1 family protein
MIVGRLAHGGVGPQRHEGRAQGSRCGAPLAVLLLVDSLLALGCYRPAHLECRLRCGPPPALACPEGTTCNQDDGYCHRPKTPACPAVVPAPGADGAPPAGREAGTPASDGAAPAPTADARPADSAPAPPAPDAAAPASDAATFAPSLDAAPGGRDGAAPASGWKQLVAGATHTCGLTAGGGLYCWGDGRTGALGAGKAEIGATPRLVPGAWIAVAAGASHTCGIRSGGALYCWGDNGAGQLGLGSLAGVELPTPIAEPASGWTAIAAGEGHTCGLRGGELYCWGANDVGQLGVGSGEAEIGRPTRVGDAADYSAISLGKAHTCALRGQVLYCWGDNALGRLGAGRLDAPVRAVPALPVGGAAARWTAVSTGWSFTCGLRTDGSRWCWGSNNLQQLGCDRGTPCATQSEVWEPARGDARTDWEAIAAGGTHACGRRGTTVECWGDHFEGQAGRRFESGFLVERGTVTAPASPFASITAGGAHTCAVAMDGSAWCWGSASRGQLGEGSVADHDTPVAVAGDLRWRSLSAGWTRHTCGVDVDQVLRCWGAGSDGQLGLGGVEDSYLPAMVDTSRPWSAAEAGLDFSCALGGGAIFCWGTDHNGELGGPNARTRPTRIDDGGGDDWTALTVGRGHACGLRRSGMGSALWCWGDNGQGQAGGADAIRPRPGAIDADTSWIAVDAGLDHTCGLRAGQLWCWGGGARAPVRIGAGAQWASVAVGGELTCALDRGSLLFCGPNAADPSQPVGALTPIGGAWAAVGAGERHVCAATAAGKLSCWGNNGFGQLGLGGTTSASAPTELAGAQVWSGVSMGEAFTCGVTAGKQGFCWGLGHRGQLGTGHGSRPLPVRVSGM